MGTDFEQKKYRKDGAIAVETIAFHSGRDENGEELLIIAPHGGSIEKNTCDQAGYLHDQLAEQGVTTWIFQGKSGGRNAFETWHVPSTEISGENPQFDLLYEYVEHRHFNYGISFHGFSQEGILIGGQVSERHKQFVADNLRDALPANIPVDIATSHGENAGMADTNILNRLTDHPMQLEQSERVRERYSELVVDVLEGLHAQLSENVLI